MSATQPSLARTTLRGIGVSYGSAVLTGAMQIATTSVVARMVSPGEFGILAMAQLGVRLAGYFSQFGVGSALIQKRDLNQGDTAAAHVLAILAGILFTAVGLVLAPLGRPVFHSGEVVWVIRALAFTFLFTGFTVAPLNLLRRHLRFGVISAIEITSYVLGYALPCLALVLKGKGLWGLVAGSLGMPLVQLALYHWAEPVTWKVVKEWKIYRDLIAFGSKISITSFLEFVTNSMDSFVIGRYLGPKPLGLYTRASNLATTPLYMITSAATRVLFPAFARVQEDAVRLARTYRESLTLLFVLTCPLGLSMIPSAPHIVRLLLGPSWAEAAAPLAIFGAMVPFNMAVVLPGIVLDATGTLTKKLRVRGVTLVGAGLLIYLNRDAGILAIAWVMLGTSVITFLCYHFLVIQQLKMPWASALSPILLGACAGVAPMLVIHFLIGLVNPGLFPALVIEGTVLVVSYALVIAFSPFSVVNAALSRVLAAALGPLRPIPENYRTRCLAWQFLATARSSGEY